MKWLWQYLKSMGDNFGSVDGRLYRGSNPSDKEYKELKEMGFTTIVNLIDGDQLDAYRLAISNDLHFYHLPMKDNAPPDPLIIKSFLDLMKLSHNSKVYLHCKGGRHRTGLLCAVYRVKIDWWTKTDAWKEADNYGWYSFNGHKPLKDWFFKDFKPEDFQ